MPKNEEVQVRDLLVPGAPTGEMLSANGAHKSKETRSVTGSKSQPISEHSLANARGLQERCRQLCLTCFFDERAPIRSLGFTSPLKGEGKTFLATVTARVLANDSSNPVTLLECNWENPTLHEYYGFSRTPGLAEWLRGECSEWNIRYQVTKSLTVIPAGDGRQDAVKLLQQLRQKGLMDKLANSNELVVVDLPAIVTTAYGPIAANLVEALIIVVRAGVTPDALVTETCTQLKDLPVHGMILNQVESHIPRWLRQIL
jgi:Mrp family chromosome partitioning ATPase